MRGRWGRVPLLAALAWSAGSVVPDMLQAGEGGEALALIDLEVREGGIEIVGGALAVKPGEFRGEMVIDRKGASGSVSTRQSRDFSLSAGERSEIARIGVSHEGGDRLTVTVILTRDGVFVSQAMLSTTEK